MDIYMYASTDTPPDAAAQNFLDIMHLHRIGFLRDDSTIWINADAPEDGMWTLTDTSSFVKMFRTVYPGWIRLTRSHARWGRTARETSSSDAKHILDMREISGDDDPRATIVLLHREPSATVGILADGERHHLRNGAYRFDPFTVIDVSSYKPVETRKPSPYVAAHAMLNGAAIMSSTAHDGGEFVRENMELFKANFDMQQLEFLHGQWKKIEEHARIQTEYITDKIKQHGQESRWINSTATV